jgi:hypothetical protein
VLVGASVGDSSLRAKRTHRVPNDGGRRRPRFFAR